MEVKNYSEIRKDLINDFVSNQGKVTDFNDGSVIVSIIESFAREEEKKYVATKLGYVQNLRAVPYSLFDFRKKEGTFAVGTVVFNRAKEKDFVTIVPIGTEVSGGDNTYITTEIARLEAGSVSSNPVTVRSVEVGSDKNIEVGIISKIDSVVSSDVVAVTNTVRISGGCDNESEIEMLKRFKDYVAGLQGTSKYGLKSAAENVTGVRSVNVVEDFNTDSIYPVIVYAEDGSGRLADDVKKAIVNVVEGDGTSSNPGKRAPGINVLVKAPDIVTVDFDVKVTVYRADPVTAEEEIKNTIRDYINSLAIGEDVVLTSVILQIRSLSYVTDVVINTPVANLPIAGNQIARFNNAEIDVD